MRQFLPAFTATKLQISTYLLGIALFSISFLVFLNSVISFVVTDVIGERHGTGDIVGTLGFADELLALIACPLWGILSDRVGVRVVAVTGYTIVGISLICLVQSTNVYPQLLLGRLGFSLGAAACSTMVTAVLPTMVVLKPQDDDEPEETVVNGNAQTVDPPTTSTLNRSGGSMHAPARSVSSELTITPTRYRSNTGRQLRTDESVEPSRPKGGETSQLAGFVGFFTGAGALVALLIFLPLPAQFQQHGQDQSQSVKTSFYIVGSIALLVAIFIFLGLRNLPNENGKSLSALWRRPYDEDTKTDETGHLHTRLVPAPSYFRLARDALMLGFIDRNVGLGYLSGFVARASSVAISLFIPLFVKSYFIDQGFCSGNPHDPTDIKEHCRQAYTLASALSGMAETAALLCAPFFGWAGGRLLNSRVEWPLLAASVFGIVGYVAFGNLSTPDPFHGSGGGWAILAVVLIGINQIGAIVCSLALIGRSVQDAPLLTSADPNGIEHERPTTVLQGSQDRSAQAEAAPLLSENTRTNDGRGDAELRRHHRLHLKGSIAGMYSFIGGAGILLLNKLGGSLFDTWTRGAPFFLLAIFNSVLFVVVMGAGLISSARRSDRVAI